MVTILKRAVGTALHSPFRDNLTMRRTLIQAFRFGLVGVLSNAVLFGVYLLLTGFGLGPKLAMTMLFCIGVGQTFFFNRNWTFSYDARGSGRFKRYICVYLVAYFGNLVALFVLVDLFLFPHQVVQAVAIVCCAGFLFVAQKLWVFRVN